MKPNDHFSFVKNNLVNQDSKNLLRFYLPILGGEATNLYLYCLAFWDNGNEQHTFGQILNHLNIGMEVLKTGLNRLTALGLLDFYQEETSYVLKLYPTLSTEDFLAHHVYRRLLEKRIGQAAVEAMEQTEPRGQKLSKKLSDIFDVEEEPVATSKKQRDFDLPHFKQLMARENLRFADEKEDLLSLFAISEQQNWTWYETYVLAKETAVNHVISTKRMQRKLAQKRVEGEFSPKEATLIREAKSADSVLFLAKMKKSREGASMTSVERKLLTEVGSLGLLDEVINVIIFYDLNKNDSATLRKNHVLSIANDFVYKKVYTAEEAVLKIRERNQSSKKNQEGKTSPASNVPDWSNPDYKNETSTEQQAKLEEQKRRLLAKLDGGGD